MNESLVSISAETVSTGSMISDRHHGNALDEDTKQLLLNFFERDDNTRITTGKKQTCTKDKIKKQKRILLDSMLNLHEKFLAENPDKNISYVTFTRNRPFWVRIPTAKDRDTCLCKKHENIQLMADKLFQLGLIKVKNCENTLEMICCNTSNYDCMARECGICRDRVIAFSSHGPINEDAVVVWSEWTTVNEEYKKDGQSKTAKVTAKRIKRGSLGELKAKFDESVRNVLARHVYIIRHQFRCYKQLKETLDVNEVVVHVDFSENYVCRNAAEIQAAHFGASNRQASLHTGVLYTVDGHVSFASISTSFRHDPAAIWAHLRPILLELRQTNPEISDIHFFSDGPTTQYKNKQNFFLFSTQLHQMGFTAGSWNFFESGHGKGASDANGGFLKRHADAQLNCGVDIPDAKELFSILKNAHSHTKLYFVDEGDVTNMDLNCSKTVKAIPGTTKLHQLISNEALSIAFRSLSCFCDRPTACGCYDVRRSRFQPLETSNSVKF